MMDDRRRFWERKDDPCDTNEARLTRMSGGKTVKRGDGKVQLIPYIRELEEARKDIAALEEGQERLRDQIEKRDKMLGEMREKLSRYEKTEFRIWWPDIWWPDHQAVFHTFPIRGDRYEIEREAQRRQMRDPIVPGDYDCYVVVDTIDKVIERYNQVASELKMYKEFVGGLDLCVKRKPKGEGDPDE